MLLECLPVPRSVWQLLKRAAKAFRNCFQIDSNGAAGRKSSEKFVTLQTVPSLFPLKHTCMQSCVWVPLCRPWQRSVAAKSHFLRALKSRQQFLFGHLSHSANEVPPATRIEAMYLYCICVAFIYNNLIILFHFFLIVDLMSLRLRILVSNTFGNLKVCVENIGYKQNEMPSLKFEKLVTEQSLSVTYNIYIYLYCIYVYVANIASNTVGYCDLLLFAWFSRGGELEIVSHNS